HPVVGSLFPATAWQANIGTMRARAEQGAAAGVPSKEEKSAMQPRKILRVYRHAAFAGKRWLRIPFRGASFIETERLPNVLVDLQIAKTSLRTGPANTPAAARHEIAFMRAIPRGGSNLNEEPPAESDRKVGG